MSPEVAVAELQRNSGSQFDPRIVRAFLTALSQRHPGLVGGRVAEELT